jgi:GntR family transcriptional regulator/MocR family aminotransferase
MKRSTSETTLNPRRRRFSLPPISLEPRSAQPMYLQFCVAVERAIRNGLLPAGSRLPSTRAAARLLGISRTTVLTAYEMLAADDLIESAIGSGTRVRRARMMPRLKDPDGNLLYLNL